jgi:hypothetical protein
MPVLVRAKDTILTTAGRFIGAQRHLNPEVRMSRVITLCVNLMTGDETCAHHAHMVLMVGWVLTQAIRDSQASADGVVTCDLVSHAETKPRDPARNTKPHVKPEYVSNSWAADKRK